MNNTNVILSVQPGHEAWRFGIAKLSVDSFKKVFDQAVKEIMLQENRSFVFVVDENNRSFINSLYNYLTYNSNYEGDLEKGILLTGNIGSGKTFLMKTFTKTIEIACNKFVTSLHAKELNEKIEKNGLVYFRRRPLFLDDLGKEVKECKVFGTIIKPVEDIFAIRDQCNTITFATGNYKMESYQEMYSKHIYDRMRAMFNVHTLSGPSRRK